MQIFRDQIARQSAPAVGRAGRAAAARSAIETDTVTSTADGSPYSWDVDLIAVSLANFNYRTLGLVRDYDELLTGPVAHAAFDELFSDRPRDVAPTAASCPLTDRYLVVPADGSQLAAVAQARRGDNFVIQGPPGTGKSQTITNLIADFVARGKRVLFVCQKRAALDVVHARLRAGGSTGSARWSTTARRTRRRSSTGCARRTRRGWPTRTTWTADRGPADALVARLIARWRRSGSSRGAGAGDRAACGRWWSGWPRCGITGGAD